MAVSLIEVFGGLGSGKVGEPARYVLYFQPVYVRIMFRVSYTWQVLL